MTKKKKRRENEKLKYTSIYFQIFTGSNIQEKYYTKSSPGQLHLTPLHLVELYLIVIYFTTIFVVQMIPFRSIVQIFVPGSHPPLLFGIPTTDLLKKTRALAHFFKSEQAMLQIKVLIQGA